MLLNLAQEENNFYKCAISDIFGEKCMTCIDNYYLGAIDNKCSTIEGCEISENENKCKQCYDNYYLRYITYFYHKLLNIVYIYYYLEY